MPRKKKRWTTLRSLQIIINALLWKMSKHLQPFRKHIKLPPLLIKHWSTIKIKLFLNLFKSNIEASIFFNIKDLFGTFWRVLESPYFWPRNEYFLMSLLDKISVCWIFSPNCRAIDFQWVGFTYGFLLSTWLSAVFVSMLSSLAAYDQTS